MFKHTPYGVSTMFTDTIEDVKEHIVEGYEKIAEQDFSDPDFEVERLMQKIAAQKALTANQLENMSDAQIMKAADELRGLYVDIDTFLECKLTDLRDIHERNVVEGFHPKRKFYQKELLSRLSGITELQVPVKAASVVFQRDNLNAVFGEADGQAVLGTLRQKWREDAQDVLNQIATGQ